MIDHVSATARLATAKPFVDHELPSWSLELMGCLLFVMAAIVITALGQLVVVANERTDAHEEAAFWRELALSPDQASQCSTQNVPPEWRRALAAECDVLADLLKRAREP